MAVLNEEGRTDDVLTLRWLKAEWFGEGPESYAQYNELMETEEVKVQECGGQLSISKEPTFDLTATDYKVQIYYKSRLLGEQAFSLQAQ